MGKADNFSLLLNNLCNVNKNNYEGYSQSFINLPNVNNKYFDYSSMLYKVNVLLGDNHVMNSNISCNFQRPFNRDMCDRENNILIPQKNIKSQGHNTQIHTHPHIKKHTTTQSNREIHNISHKHNTPTQTLRTQTMAMYVKHPEYHFGYHNVSSPKTNNHNLRFSKKQNSKVKTQNTSSIARAVQPKKKVSSIYSQGNLKSGGTIKDKRIPVGPPKGPTGGQAACKHPRDSQVGAHNTGSLNNLKSTPNITGVDKPKRKLFTKDITQNPMIDNMVPKGTDLEILLINSCKINAIKVQDIVEHFIKEKKHTVMFCMTETKVDSLDFNPSGITLFSAHRNKKEKRGGGGTKKREKKKKKKKKKK